MATPPRPVLGDGAREPPLLDPRHSGCNGVVYFDTSNLDANQAALQEWTHLARAGNPVAPTTPACQRCSAAQHPIMSLQPADTSATVRSSFIAAQHNCSFWNKVTSY